MRAEGFYCNLDVLYRGLGIGKPDPYWIQIRISIQPKMLDPDPDEMNADPQPCSKYAQTNNANIILIPENGTQLTKTL